jgi:acarbose 7IV-phosphotransferase
MENQSRFVVSGLLNVETTLKIGGFPLEYFPVAYPFGGVGCSVSGVGVNVALALSALDDRVEFCCLTGRDGLGGFAISQLASRGLSTDRILRSLEKTPQSVILFDPSGKRQIHVDLKDIQENIYPAETFEAAAKCAGMAVLCNVNFNRPLLKCARSLGLPVATDVHVLKDPADDYNADFMEAADILFLSDEGLWASPDEAARELMGRYGPRIIVIGMGAEGALLLEKGKRPERLPARKTRPVMNAIGAGDALFSAFAHFYAKGCPAETALERASLFASWKIGENGGAFGFLSEEKLLELEKRD